MISKSITDDEVLFNCCKFTQESNGNIKISTEDYMSRGQSIRMSRMRMQQQNELSTQNEIKAYGSLSGALA